MAGPYLFTLQSAAMAGQVPVFNAVTGRFEPGNVSGSGGGVIPNSSVVRIAASGTNTSFATITAALAASSAGDVVVVGPGTYAESFTIPVGVVLTTETADNVVVVTGAAATGTRVTMSNSSRLIGFLVLAPTDAVPGVLFSGTGSVAVLRVSISGAGAAGIGISMRGSGTMGLNLCSQISGTLGTFLEVTAGTMFAGSSAIAFGTTTIGLNLTGGVCDFETFAINSGATVTDSVRIGAATLIAQNFDLRGTNCVHITSNNANIDMISSKMDGGVGNTHLLVDPALTLGTFHLVASEMDRSKITAPGAWLAGADVAMSFQDEVEDDEAFVFWAEVNVGQPERGRELIGGEGDNYTRGMKVVTSDGTATSTTEGGNLTDVSTAASSPSGSTFTYQGVTANHCIYTGSTLEDASSVVKHWGYQIVQTIGATEVTPLSFVVEIWNGAAWIAIGHMCSHATLFHRYADAMFIRATTEVLRYGIDGDTTWATKTIDGATLFWARVRIATTVTIAPTFQQFKLSPSHSQFSIDGTHTFHGASRFRRTLSAQVNNGEAGVVANSSVAVGSGGSPTGWTQVGRNNLMNGDGDELFYVFTLPHGIDTSFPLRFEALISVESSSGAVTLILSALPLEAANVLVADPAGGITPVARTVANTETFTAEAAVAVTSTALDNAVVDKMQCIEFAGAYDISSHYEGDAVLVRLELDISNATDIIAWEVAVEGVNWTNGEKITN